MLDVSKITVKGQVTIPQEFREKLNLKSGDKVIFVENKDGDIVIKNASLMALDNIKETFKGLSDKLRIQNEGEAADYLKRFRKEQSTNE